MTSTPSAPCTLELVKRKHAAHLHFGEPGRAHIRVAGLKKVLNEADARITETRTLTVR